MSCIDTGDLVEATKGLIGERAIVTGVDENLKFIKGKAVKITWVTVSWSKNAAVTTMPKNHFKLIHKALIA